MLSSCILKNGHLINALFEIKIIKPFKVNIGNIGHG